MKSKTVYKVRRKNTNEYLSYVDQKAKRLCFSASMRVFDSLDTIFTSLHLFAPEILQELEIVELVIREETKAVHSLADTTAQWKIKVKQFSQNKKSSTAELIDKLETRNVLKQYSFIVELKPHGETIRAATKKFKELVAHMKEINLINRSKVRYVGPKLQAGAAFAFKDNEDVVRFKLAFGEEIHNIINLKESI